MFIYKDWFIFIWKSELWRDKGRDREIFRLLFHHTPQPTHPQQLVATPLLKLGARNFSYSPIWVAGMQGHRQFSITPWGHKQEADQSELRGHKPAPMQDAAVTSRIELPLLPHEPQEIFITWSHYDANNQQVSLANYLFISNSSLSLHNSIGVMVISLKDLGIKYRGEVTR